MIDRDDNNWRQAAPAVTIDPSTAALSNSSHDYNSASDSEHDMSDQQKAEQLLEGAYALKTADDNIRYYRDFAPLYDTRFADELGYCYPAAIARVYHQHAGTEDTPIADIGCGTGLVAAEIGCKPDNIDGLDISPEMLAAAGAKGLYNRLIEIDLATGTNAIKHQYGAMVSAGTFTHGHLGAEVLPSLLSIARPGALFCLGVNSEHFQTHDFESTLASMQRDNLIHPPVLERVAIYSNPDSEHADDTATILVYRKA